MQIVKEHRLISMAVGNTKKEQGISGSKDAYKTHNFMHSNY